MASPDYPSEVLARLRDLPKVDELIARLDEAPPSLRAEAARTAIAAERDRITGGSDPSGIEDIVATANEHLRTIHRSAMQPVINATGVLIHTNLGRVPLGERQIDRVREVASSYTNLEYDLIEGKRGDRYDHASDAVARLTGAESALVVNNNAAAVLLVLASLCSGREVIISRGELIEIGGEFRIPDVMGISGATLVEIGTTNRTHLVDYERAISERTGAVMKVHTSNYKIVGFSSTVDRRDLAKLARGRGVMLIEDLGSGSMGVDDVPDWMRNEPPVQRSIENGVDIVTFSGDKLLGGPQAGIIAGRRELVDRIKKNPLLRTMRVDKMTLAALQATLQSYLDGSWRELPFWRMALAEASEIEARAGAVIASLEGRLPDGIKIELVPSISVPGGGSLPGEGIASWAISITHPERGASEIHHTLRHGSTPVIGRIDDEKLLLDLRTVEPASDDALAALLVAALA